MDRDSLITCAGWIDTIIPITFVTSAAMALVLFWLRYEVMRKQSWPLYIAWAYAVFTIQYLLRGVVGKPGADSAASLSPDAWVAVLGSTANNVLFFLAAAALLGMAPVYRRIIVAPAIVTIGLHAFDLGDWQRFPDAVLSVVCLTTLGWALAINLKLGSPNLQSRSAFVMGFGYSLVNVMHALTPFLSKSGLLLGDQVLDEGLIGLRSDACDATMLIAALIFKFILFALALVPIIQSIGLLKPAVFRNTLDNIRDGNKEFFHNNGIVRAIGKSYGADIAEVCMRIPKMTRQQLLYWHWHNKETINDYSLITTLAKPAPAKKTGDQANFQPRPTGPKSNILPTPSRADSIIGRMFETGETCTSKDLAKDRLPNDLAQAHKFGINSLVVTPIRYHGATIGGLILKWKSSSAYSDVLVGQLEFLANYLAPGLQSERQLSTLDQCTFKLPQLELGQPGGPYSLSKRLAIVQNTLSSLATLVRLDIGFRAKWSACNGQECYQDQILTTDDERNNKFASKKTHKLAQGFGEEKIMVRKTPLVVRDFKLGALMLAYPKIDKRSTLSIPLSPMLGGNYVHRRTIATLLADAILDSTRFELSAMLSEVQNSLNAPEIINVESWYQTLKRASKKVGLTWLVAKGPAGTFYGYHGCIKLIKKAMPLGGQRAKKIVISKTRLERPFADAHVLLSINLPLTGARLWCGVAREDFGAELDFLSPWRDYLERFADAADSALTRLTAARDLDRFALEAARQQGLTTALITTGTMTHQLVNFANGFSSAIDTLEENISYSDLRDDAGTGNLLQSLKTSTQRLSELVEPLRTATALDDRRPCKIGEAIDTTRQLHEARIEQQHIKFISNIDGKSPIQVDLSFYVLTLALANLVTNGIDATGDLGTIRVTVTVDAQYVLCSVKDDGPGLAPGVSADDIFKLGVTTKKGSGGWGLYLTQRSLIENGASLELTETGPNGTAFLLQLPKAKQEHAHDKTVDLRFGG